MSAPGAQSLPVNWTACERFLGITELVQEIITSLHDEPSSLRSLALTNKVLSENALRQLWSKKRGLMDIIELLPSMRRNHSDSFEPFKKYTGYVRDFTWGEKDDRRVSASLHRLFEAIPIHGTLFPNLRVLRWTSSFFPFPHSYGLFSLLLAPSLVDVQIRKCSLKDVGECIDLIKRSAPGLQRLEVEVRYGGHPILQTLGKPEAQAVSQDDIFFPHLHVLRYTSNPADCQGIFRHLVAPSLVDLRILDCSSEDAREYLQLISQRAPGLQRLEMQVYSNSGSSPLTGMKPKAMLQDKVLFPDLRVLRWNSQSSDRQEMFRQLLGPSMLDLHIFISSFEDTAEYVKTIRRRVHSLQRLEIDLGGDYFSDFFPDLKLELDGMDINEFKTKFTLSEETFFSLASMKHLTSLKLYVPTEGYEVIDTSCFPSLRSISLRTEEFGAHCIALVKMVSSGSLEDVSISVQGDVATDMFESFVHELENHPLRKFALNGAFLIEHDDRLDIGEAILHALQPLLQQRTMTSLAIDINDLRITSHLLSALGGAYPALETLLLHTDFSHWATVGALFTIADSFPALKRVDIHVSKASNLPILPSNWQSPSKLLHIDGINRSSASEEVLAYLKALFPRADVDKYCG
ncbi:uncharacterized protein LAESUDRAFT_814538 [Laetiporus sulphureus 93-53]|uniref:F-box domain-containing protein n=1 Tax=Laetiporus sulphureus 93-53 TaxID=1314785 RepID=A0A165CXJ6_9APHY|nr:uncharacterized protein LAESUDRAFT_814538 [Laetiporus sulphureus 93-53]KZT03676.1 hypothetical protein LAESUDRAFT_814538 [Laetiporus sulphureus 93-53]